MSGSERADYLGPDGYRYVDIDGESYRADKLAWLYMTGEWPDELVHVDGDKGNNVFANLRPAKVC